MRDNTGRLGASVFQHHENGDTDGINCHDPPQRIVPGYKG